MGGQLISAAAEAAPERFAELIYLCAFVPADNDAMLASADITQNSALTGTFQPTADGLGILVADEAIVRGLNGFAGVDRRFQVTQDITDQDITLVDDYGHHPTEVAAVIETARSVWPDRRLAMIYQPHRYTRTRDLFEDFVRVLSGVDALMLLDVYSAGEEVIAGADSKTLSQAIRQRGKLSPVFAEHPQEALELVGKFAMGGDVLIVQGAGNVSMISKSLRGELD